MTAQHEMLPDPAPMPTFFMPNFLGVLFAYVLESFKAEAFLKDVLLSSKAHPYALLGLGVFCIANVNSYLGGSVVNSRVKYGVRLPNLYADTKEGNNKHAIAFNCVQRGHQNFLETYAQLVLSVLFVAFPVGRPNIAGMMLIVVSLARIMYARNYATNMKTRIGPILIAIFTMSIGIGYGFLLGLTAFGIQMIEV